MSTDTILAIDLGRYKSVACVYAPRHPRAHVPHARHHARPTSTALLARHPGGGGRDRGVRQRRLGPRPGRRRRARGEGRQHRRRGAGSSSTSSGRPTTTTPSGWPSWRPSASCPTVALPDPATRQRRMLIAFRQELVGRRVACQNRIRALFAGQGLPTPRGARAWTATGLAGIEAQAKAAGRVRPGRAVAGDAAPGGGRVPGAGGADRRRPRRRLDALAAADAGDAAAGDDPRGRARGRPRRWRRHLGDAQRFASRPSRSGRTPGLVPTQYQSGVTDRKGRITRRGPGVLRKLLVECAWCMLRYNPWARAVYARLTGGGHDAEEAGDRGAGAEAVGAVLGDAAGRGAVAGRPGAGAAGSASDSGLSLRNGGEPVETRGGLSASARSWVWGA